MMFRDLLQGAIMILLGELQRPKLYLIFNCRLISDLPKEKGPWTLGKWLYFAQIIPGILCPLHFPFIRELRGNSLPNKKHCFMSLLPHGMTSLQPKLGTAWFPPNLDDSIRCNDCVTVTQLLRRLMAFKRPWPGCHEKRGQTSVGKWQRPWRFHKVYRHGHVFLPERISERTEKNWRGRFAYWSLSRLSPCLVMFLPELFGVC